VIIRAGEISIYRDNFDYLITRDESGKPIVDLKEANYFGMTDEEIQTIQLAIDNNWKIKKGELHHYQFGVYDGETYSARAPKGIHDICCKYKLFEED
jgi:hypothetical protein